jgi:hypothetical protein
VKLARVTGHLNRVNGDSTRRVNCNGEGRKLDVKSKVDRKAEVV